jgi:hypothetical protein
MWVLYESSVAISHKTRCISTASADILTASYGIMSVYFKNHTKYISTLCWKNVEIRKDKTDMCYILKGERQNVVCVSEQLDFSKDR